MLTAGAAVAPGAGVCAAGPAPRPVTAPGGAIGPFSGTIHFVWKADGTNDGPIKTSGRYGDEVIGSFTEDFHADWDVKIALDGKLAGEKRSPSGHVEAIYGSGKVTVTKGGYTYTRTETVNGESKKFETIVKTTGGPVPLGGDRTLPRCEARRLPRVDKAFVGCAVAGFTLTREETIDGKPETPLTIPASPFSIPGDPRTDPEALVGFRSPIVENGANLYLKSSFTYPTKSGAWQASVAGGSLGGALGEQMQALAGMKNLPPEARTALAQMAQVPAGGIAEKKPGEQWGGGGPWPGSVTVSWDLTSAPAELVLKGGDGFDRWIPVFDGGAKGRINVVAEIRSKDPAKKLTDKMTISLESSHVPGKCINYPPGGGSEADLFFPKKQPQGIIWVSETEVKTARTVEKAEVTVESRDSGGYGKITARGEILKLNGKDEKGRDHLPVPEQDENESGIAKAWLDKIGDPSKGDPGSWDGETEPPGNKVPGDGLTLYEEYRGAMIGGKWQQLKTASNKMQKKIFVVDKTKDGRVRSAIATFGSISELNVYGDLLPSELDGDRLINFNKDDDKGHHQTDQHGVVVAWSEPGKNGLKDANDIGDAYSADLAPGTPGHIIVCALNRQALKKYSSPGFTEWVVVHELGHAVKIGHHGDLSPVTVKGQEIAVARKGGEFSGAEHCPMRYRNAQYYTRTEVVGKTHRTRTRYFLWRTDEEVSLEDMTPTEVGIPDFALADFCDDKTGTGYVAPRAGDAANGGCKHQIQVKDQ